MKYVLLPFTAIVFLFSACGGDSNSGSTDLTPASFDSIRQAQPNVQLVDVRTLEEYSEGHLAGALNYDWNDASFTENAKSLDKSLPVLVYCRSGNRSAEAAKYLRENGYTVYELDGGISAWESAGMPIEKMDEAEVPETPVDGEVTLDMYKQTLAENDVVLVDFTATWCGPCKMLAPSLHELETELSDKFVLLTVDVDRDYPVAEYMNIMAMPTLVLYKKGEIQWRNEGVVAKDMIAGKINSVQ